MSVMESMNWQTLSEKGPSARDGVRRYGAAIMAGVSLGMLPGCVAGTQSQPRATVTVTAPAETAPTSVITVTETAPVPTETVTKEAPQEKRDDNIHIVDGFITCVTGEPMVGAWIEHDKGAETPSDWVEKRPTDDVSEVYFEAHVTDGVEFQIRTGCGGTPQEWETVTETPWMQVSGDSSFHLYCYRETGQCQTELR